MTEIPNWHIMGDWFDNCSCAVACPCTFAQAPDNGFCESMNAPTSVRRRCFLSFSADVQEDSWVSSPHCSQKVGSFAVRSVRGLPTRSRPTALNGEQKSQAK